MATSSSVTQLFADVSAIQLAETLMARDPIPPFGSTDQARLADQSDALGEISAALFSDDPATLDQANVDNAENHVQIVQATWTTIRQHPEDHSVTADMLFASVDAAISSLAFA